MGSHRSGDVVFSYAAELWFFVLYFRKFHGGYPSGIEFFYHLFGALVVARNCCLQRFFEQGSIKFFSVAEYVNFYLMEFGADFDSGDVENTTFFCQLIFFIKVTSDIVIGK